MSVPALRAVERKEIALQGALETLAPGPWVERRDTPDGVVTAVRRLPPVTRQIRSRSRPIWTRVCEPRSNAAASNSSTAIRPRRLPTSPAGRNVVVTTPTASGKTLCYNLPVLDAILREPGDPRALPVSDQGAGAGSDGRAPRAGRAGERCRRRRDRRAHLRRRYARRRAPDDPHARAGRAQQSRHAARRHPAASPAVGEAVREPALRHHRRAARVSRRLRQSPLQRPAAPAAHRAALRIGSAVHLLVGDDCQPARAGRATHRTAVCAGVGERRPAGREVLRLHQSAGRQSRARHPPLVSERNAASVGRVPAPPFAGDRLRAEPAGDRDPHDLSERGFRGRARACPS